MRVAALDIGTNSTRLLVADAGPEGVTEIDRITTVTGLGQGVDATGRLAPDAIDRTLETLSRYAARARELAADRMGAVATSATRDAANRDTFLDRAEAVLGVRPKVISGDEEARLAFAGATAGRDDAESSLVVDIGGGSTEWVTQATADSADIGSVRLTEQALPDHPASFDQLQHASEIAATALEALPTPPGITTIVGVAGTWTSLSAIIQQLPAYDRARVHNSVISRLAVDRAVVALAAKTLEETEAIPSLDPARAPVILGGAIVARECMRRLGADHVHISEHDLLDGLAARLARRSG